MTDLERINELLEIAKKNDIFAMTTYDFSDFTRRITEAVEQYPMTAFEQYKEALDNANIKYVEVMGNFEEDLDDNLYIATYGSLDSNVIMVQEFNNNGTLNDIYIADACSTLEEFVLCMDNRIKD